MKGKKKIQNLKKVLLYPRFLLILDLWYNPQKTANCLILQQKWCNATCLAVEFDKLNTVAIPQCTKKYQVRRYHLRKKTETKRLAGHLWWSITFRLMLSQSLYERALTCEEMCCVYILITSTYKQIFTCHILSEIFGFCQL